MKMCCGNLMRHRMKTVKQTCEHIISSLLMIIASSSPSDMKLYVFLSVSIPNFTFCVNAEIWK